jgi:stage II sporulation protein D
MTLPNVQSRSFRWLCAASLSVISLVTNPGCDTVRDTAHDTIDAVLPAPAKPIRKEVDLVRKEPDIRVRVARQLSEQRISGPDRFVIRSSTGASSIAYAPAVVRGPIKVSSSSRGIRITDASGAAKEWGFGSDLDILVSDGSPQGAVETPGESMRIDTRLIPGYLTIKPAWSTDADHFDMVATMPIESYLPGVLSKELLKDWPRQTFEAQAVAARTYALEERLRARNASKPVDVEDTIADQVFGGGTSLGVAIEAAHATRGWVLTENGRFIRAYFCSQCGGRPASASAAWSARGAPEFNQFKCLQGKQRPIFCQSAPLYRWNVTRSADDWNKRLRAWGRSKSRDIANLSRTRRIEIKDRNDALRPTVFLITDDKSHEFTLAPEELREAANYPASGLLPITRENRLNSADVDITIHSNEVRISGRGFGHGVGMCQWCAKGMGNAGLDWRSMVEQFYPGVEVRKLY